MQLTVIHAVKNQGTVCGRLLSSTLPEVGMRFSLTLGQLQSFLVLFCTNLGQPI